MHHQNLICRTDFFENIFQTLYLNELVCVYPLPVLGLIFLSPQNHGISSTVRSKKCVAAISWSSDQKWEESVSHLEKKQVKL